MPRPTIDFLNGRRESAQRKGKAIFAKTSANIDKRRQESEMDVLDRAGQYVDAQLDDFRSFIRNLPGVESIARGETIEDLVF